MVGLNNMIIEYITTLYEVKGGITVYSYGTRVYHKEICKHIRDVFNLDEHISSGYLSYCFSDTDLDYEMFVTLKKPSLFSNYLIGGMDFANIDGDVHIANIDGDVIRLNQYTNYQPIRHMEVSFRFDPELIFGTNFTGVSSIAP